jgi:hypothetical protein
MCDPAEAGLTEGLNAHRLAGNHLDDGSVTRLDEFGLYGTGQYVTSKGDMEDVPFSTDLPVRRSIFSSSSANLQAM